MNSSTRLAMAVAACLIASTAGAGVAFPTNLTPAPEDIGTLQSTGSEIAITLALKLRNTQEAESLLTELSDASSPHYHQFLTPPQFRAKFGPAAGVGPGGN